MMSSNGAGIGQAVEQVDDFLEDVGERLGSAVAGVSRALARWGAGLVNGDRPPRERAEVIVTGVEEHFGDYSAAVGHGIRRVAARAKEEFDDIRAEAEAKKEQWRADGSEPQTAATESSSGA
jgi:hypothetical protein